MGNYGESASGVATTEGSMTKKGQGIGVFGGQTQMNEWKRKLSAAAEGVPVLEWKPYRVPQAMLDAQERCKELSKWPSRWS